MGRADLYGIPPWPMSPEIDNQLDGFQPRDNSHHPPQAAGEGGGTRSTRGYLSASVSASALVVVTRSQTQYSWWRLLLFIACSDRRTTPSKPVRWSRHNSQQQPGGSLIRPSIHLFIHSSIRSFIHSVSHSCAQVGETGVASSYHTQINIVFHKTNDC